MKSEFFRKKLRTNKLCLVTVAIVAVALMSLFVPIQVGKDEATLYRLFGAIVLGAWQHYKWDLLLLALFWFAVFAVASTLIGWVFQAILIFVLETVWSGKKSKVPGAT